MAADVETVVVGAGVVGLAVARSLARAGQEVIVLERHARIGTETSSRNSEVIHAGIYYPPGSARARLCVAGKEMLYRFCAENGVTHDRCGKLLVATTEAEIPKLDAIASNAARNGVNDLVQLSAAEACDLEPELRCVAALLSPSTGVIDSHGLMQALDGHIASCGGEVILNTEVTGISQKDGLFKLQTSSGGEAGALSCRRLVLAGGLSATRLGGMLDYAPAYRVPQTHPARGHYFALDRKAPFRRLVYPMPVGAWLGVHLTLDVAGRARFGPDIEWCDGVSYDFDDKGGARRALFEREIRRYWPGIPEGGLQPDSVGVRPKIYREGEPPADFAIHGHREHGIAGLVALYGIESPGLTSSLAIGDQVAGMLLDSSSV
ncbi:MAG: NAD(P)/FAD-dependent oxidoreductase [Hyphomicrobium sp.]